MHNNGLDSVLSVYRGVTCASSVGAAVERMFAHWAQHHAREGLHPYFIAFFCMDSWLLVVFTHWGWGKGLPNRNCAPWQDFML